MRAPDTVQNGTLLTHAITYPRVRSRERSRWSVRWLRISEGKNTHTHTHVNIQTVNKQGGEKEGDGMTHVERFMSRKRARPPGRGASVYRVPEVRHVAGMLAVVVRPQFVQYVVL